MCLTLLAPDIVKAILDGRQQPKIMLAVPMERFPTSWAEQVPELICDYREAGHSTNRTGGILPNFSFKFLGCALVGADL